MLASDINVLSSIHCLEIYQYTHTFSNNFIKKKTEHAPEKLSF